MRIINSKELFEVTLDRTDIQNLHDFFKNHFLIPNYSTLNNFKNQYPIYDKFVNLFKLLIDEEANNDK